MNIKTYFYPYKIQKNENMQLKLIPNTKNEKNLLFEQFTLLSSMLQFGYIQFYEGQFKITDKQIIDFYNYAKTTVLKNIDINKYYALLEISEPYIKQIPTITEKERFISDSYQMNVAWENDTSTGKMKSAPKSYKRNGLEIYNFEDEKLGSIFPEYFELYEIIDNANRNWKAWTKTERYSFLDTLVELSHKRKFVIPDELLQAHQHIN